MFASIIAGKHYCTYYECLAYIWWLSLIMIERLTFLSRKCGRVVCNACSPHRITIPYQFIVQPPTAEQAPTAGSHHRPSLDASRAGSEFASLGGGERVRLCNPCVPDPNIAPPQTPTHEALRRPSNTNTHSRSVSLASPNSSALSIANYQRRPRESSILRQGQSSSDVTIASTSQPHDSRVRPEGGRHPAIEVPSIRSRSSTVCCSKMMMQMSVSANAL